MKKPPGFPSGGSQVFKSLVSNDLPVINPNDIHARHVLRAFLAGRALLDEADVAVDAFDLHLPQRLRDRLGLGLAGDADRFDDGVDAVPAAEALGEAAGVVLAGVPV